MVDKIKALELREQGKTYAEISDELGCSVAWCKSNLKGTKKKDIKEEDYIALIDKGRSFDCITKGEILGKVLVDKTEDYKDQSKEMLKTTNRVKRKLAKEGDVIVRQAWIHPARARFSYNNMISYIDALNDRLDEYVRMHLLECGFEDEDNYNSTLAFMVMNSMFGQRIMKKYPAGVFEAINNAVESIEERNGSCEPIQLPSSILVEISEKDIPY